METKKKRKNRKTSVAFFLSGNFSTSNNMSISTNNIEQHSTNCVYKISIFKVNTRFNCDGIFAITHVLYCSGFYFFIFFFFIIIFYSHFFAKNTALRVFNAIISFSPSFFFHFVWLFPFIRGKLVIAGRCIMEHTINIEFHKKKTK